VARDVRYQDLRTASERLAYVPWFQARDIRSTAFEFLIRTDGNPANSINIVVLTLAAVGVYGLQENGRRGET
jgi:hypothetical protein